MELFEPKPNGQPRLIALDYDFTYTADPELWDQFVAIGKARGHQFVCVTGRDVPPGQQERAIPMPVICAAGMPKSTAAYRAGYAVDIWIDDAPGSIGAPMLNWETP